MDLLSFIIPEMPGDLFKNGTILFLAEGESQYNIEKEEIEIILPIEDLMDIIIIKDLLNRDKVIIDMDMKENMEDIEPEEIDIIKIKEIYAILIVPDLI